MNVKSDLCVPFPALAMFLLRTQSPPLATPNGAGALWMPNTHGAGVECREWGSCTRPIFFCLKMLGTAGIRVKMLEPLAAEYNIFCNWSVITSISFCESPHLANRITLRTTKESPEREV